MNLSFTPDEGGDIFNATIRDSNTDSVIYTVETPKGAGGTLTTTVTRRDQIDGSTRLAFWILWKGPEGSSEDAGIVLDFRTLEEVPAREVMGSAPGAPLSMSPVIGWSDFNGILLLPDSGSVAIDDTEYRWKSKGTGSKVVVRRCCPRSPIPENPSSSPVLFSS